MGSWLLGAVVCLTFLVGCGGGPKGSLVKMDANQSELAAAVNDDSPDEAALTEELSATRLEELYAKSGIPGWDPSLEKELKSWEHQVKFDVPIQMNKQVRAYLVYFSTERKAVIQRYLARSTRYLPMIKVVFQEAGLPEDLAYLAMIESGFNPKAYSPAAAAGMWQFIKGTGLRYGLNINRYVDERRDPEKSTRAAAKYLLDLYKQFGSWYLAAASYNCGEGRVQRELNQSNHKNFWELSANKCLPTETKNYVPQMIAATIIAKNPEKFGFKHVPYQPALKCDKVQVNEATSLTAVAVAVNVPTEEIQALNPEIMRGVTPPDMPYTLNLPYNSKGLFARNITLARIEHPATQPIRTAQSSGQYHSHSKKAATHHVALAHKPAGKHRTYARHSTKKHSSRRVYAKKSSRHRSHRASAKAGVVQASLFGTPSLASKHGHAQRHRQTKKTKVALIGASKTKAKSSAVKRKKSRVTRLARRSDSNSKSGKSRKSSSAKRSRGRYSHSKHKRAIMVSEAR